MHAYTLADFSGTILKHSLDELTQSELLLTCKVGNLQSFYTPFDAVNTGAKVVLAGICPGQAQWRNALKSAQESLKQDFCRRMPFYGKPKQRARSAARSAQI